ncbi:MAG: hypothetical protein QGF09_11295 [Rhodospirillales bacterium]|nr:hypothetical protein [Rhodospirillales bacterium]
MRQTTFITLFCAAFLSIALFYLKYEVSKLDQELNFLNQAIQEDQEAIHVLKAEWSHLNDIYRLEDLAKRHLNMEPTDPIQITSAGNLAPIPEKLAQSPKASPQGKGETIR